LIYGGTKIRVIEGTHNPWDPRNSKAKLREADGLNVFRERGVDIWKQITKFFPPLATRRKSLVTGEQQTKVLLQPTIDGIVKRERDCCVCSSSAGNTPCKWVLRATECRDIADAACRCGRPGIDRSLAFCAGGQHAQKEAQHYPESYATQLTQIQRAFGLQEVCDHVRFELTPQSVMLIQSGRWEIQNLLGRLTAVLRASC
jgi:hypothetical protein